MIKPARVWARSNFLGRGWPHYRAYLLDHDRPHYKRGQFAVRRRAKSTLNVLSS